MHISIERSKSHFRYQSHTQRTDTAHPWFTLTSFLYARLIYTFHFIYIGIFICFFSVSALAGRWFMSVRSVVLKNYHWHVNSLSSCWICHILNAITNTHKSRSIFGWAAVCAHLCAGGGCVCCARGGGGMTRMLIYVFCLPVTTAAAVAAAVVAFKVFI